MKTVSMVDFQMHAAEIIASVEGGERVTITRQGRPVARIEPIREEAPDSDDPFYSLVDRAEAGDSLTNEQIDEILYGQ